MTNRLNPILNADDFLKNFHKVAANFSENNNIKILPNDQNVAIPFLVSNF